jgi:hypothetical protein
MLGNLSKLSSGSALISCAPLSFYSFHATHDVTHLREVFQLTLTYSLLQCPDLLNALLLPPTQ